MVSSYSVPLNHRIYGHIHISYCWLHRLLNRNCIPKTLTNFDKHGCLFTPTLRAFSSPWNQQCYQHEYLGMIPWNLVKHRHVCFKLPHKITIQNHHLITMWLFLKSQFLLVNSRPISASWPAWASSALGFRPSAPLSAWRDEWDIRRFIYWLQPSWLQQMPQCFCWCVLDFLTGFLTFAIVLVSSYSYFGFCLNAIIYIIYIRYL